nr:sulfatase [Allomuricauda sp.]
MKNKFVSVVLRLVVILGLNAFKTKKIKKYLTGLLFLLATFINMYGQESNEETKPNILMILVDDLKPTLGSYGDGVAISPNIDKLAASGLQFNRAYVNQAVCGPSRYNLMLGMRSTSSGIYGFGRNFRKTMPEAVTLPQYFKENGYHVESMGKVYHVGHGQGDDELSWSVPSRKDKVIEYIVPESKEGELTREEAFFENSRKYIKDLPPNRQLPRGAAWEMPDVLDDAYADGRIARHAIDRLRKLGKGEKPFMMAVGFARPHLPFSVPKKYWDMYDPAKLPMPEFEEFPEDSPKMAQKRGGEITQFFPVPEDKDAEYSEELKRNLIHGYYASVSYMDAQLGKVMNELERLGLDKNTIVLLWGDHGWHLGDHGIWTKHTNYEQPTRIPFLMRVPGITQKKTTTQQFMETVDIYPTLVDLAKLPQPKGIQLLDGISLAPSISKPDMEIKDHVYHCFKKGGYVGEAIRNQRYRMVRWTNTKNYDDVAYELYDYKEDPLETKNVAKKNKKVVKNLEAILDNYPRAQELQ